MLSGKKIEKKTKMDEGTRVMSDEPGGMTAGVVRWFR